MVERKSYFISLVHDSHQIKIPAPIDGVFIVDGIEKVIVSQEIFCTPFFIYKDNCIEYKECDHEGNFQSIEMFTDYKYMEYLKRVLTLREKRGRSLSLRNDYTNYDIYYTFSSKDRKKKLWERRQYITLDIRIYYSLVFQYLRIKGIKSHHKQSISLLYVLHYLKPDIPLSDLKAIIIRNIIGEDLPENIEITIPDAFPESTLDPIISRRKEPKESIIDTIHKMIDKYFTPDPLHCGRSSYDDRNTKFYTYLAMARVFMRFNSEKEYFNGRIDSFPFSLFRTVKYFTMENKKTGLSKFVTALNFKLYSNAKSGKVRSYFCEYPSIAVQTLSKRSYYDKLSHIRRVQIPINTESENMELRLAYEYGYFCPFETPESKEVGLVKYFGLSVLLAPDFSIDFADLASVVYGACPESSSRVRIICCNY